MAKQIEKALKGSLSREEQLQAIENAARKYYYTPEQEFDDRTKKFVIDEMCHYIKPGRILELGYTNNIWTRALLTGGGTVDIIEAASNHCDKALADFSSEPKVRIIKTLFEEFRPIEKYDTILMSGVIKHIPNDADFVKMTKTWLTPDGVVVATTPNSRSLHRRLGAYMGLELLPDSHNKRDKEVFNVHLYDRFKWQALFREAGYEVNLIKGIFLKLLSTEQLMYVSQKYDISSILEGCRQLGEELQDYAWYLLLVACLPRS